MLDHGEGEGETQAVVRIQGQAAHNSPVFLCIFLVHPDLMHPDLLHPDSGPFASGLFASGAFASGLFASGRFVIVHICVNPS
jgi:hypothetical protein